MDDKRFEVSDPKAKAAIRALAQETGLSMATIIRLLVAWFIGPLRERLIREQEKENRK